VSSKTSALALLGIATFLVGSGNIAQITAINSIGPFTTVTLRSIVAILCVLPLAIAEVGKGRSIPMHVLPSIVVAALAFGASLVAQQVGAQATTATNLGFLVNMSAVFVPLVMWAVVGKKLQAATWPVAVLAVIGAWLVTGAGSVAVGWGEGLCLLAGVFDAVWIIALAHAMPRCRAPAQVTAMLMAVTAIMGAMGSLSETFQLEDLQVAAPEVLWLGIMTSGLGFFLSNKAQETLPECLVAVMFCMEAIVSAGLGGVLLSESLQPAGYAGAAIITLAIILLNMMPSMPAAQRPP
jgi:drug/metabolite transporter (DMT)-like permease